MKFIRPDHWQPKGIDDLEPNAWQALRQRESTSIIAGPGAGKTEFLAQKAAYLLETGLCPSNKKILAISFKTDAAKNLADRVKERCSEEVSNRFISMTFDAFTKNLIDRFRMALPEHHRPSKRYEISFPSFHQEKQLISSFRNNFGNAVGIYSFTQRLQNMNQFIGSVRIGDPKLSWLEEEFLTFWLSQQINYPDGVSRVSFPALNRLAEYIVRTNVSAAKSTYLPSLYCATFFAMGSSGTFQGSRASSFSRLSASPICASTWLIYADGSRSLALAVSSNE